MSTHLEMLQSLKEVIDFEISCVDLGFHHKGVSGIAFVATADGGRSASIMTLEDPSITGAYKALIELYTPVATRDIKDLAK